MCAAAADHYEALFQKVKNVVRPHPYLDAPRIVHENADEEIPPLTLEELIGNVFGKKMKKSRDSYALNNFMFKFIDAPHWILLLDLYNRSFASAFVPDSWKGTGLFFRKCPAITSTSFQQDETF